MAAGVLALLFTPVPAHSPPHLSPFLLVYGPPVHQRGVRGKASPLSPAYMMKDRPICLVLLKQEVANPLSFAAARAGKSMAARMAMMAMTTSSSIRVNPRIMDRVKPCVLARNFI